MIKLEHVKKRFKDQIIFKDLDLVIDTVGIHVIKGRSGSGKSTLLNMIMGFEKADSGMIFTSSKPFFISQNYELIESLSVEDNILLGRNMSDHLKKLIAYFGMDDQLNKRPSELSGGQRQRVGIIRALSFRPSIILCDEPTESLDIANKILVMDLLKELAKEAIVVLATHDANLSKSYGDHFYELCDHDIMQVTSKKTKTYLMTKTKAFGNKETKSIFKKLCLKKDIAFGFFHTVLFIILVFVLLVDHLWFTIPDTNDTLNHDYMYIEVTSSRGFPYQELAIRSDETYIMPTFRFQSLYNGTRYFRTHIYPNNDQETGLVINTVAQGMYDLNIGDEVILYYLVDKVEYPYHSKVTMVIEESDTKEAHIYYDYQDFLAHLKNIPYDSTYLYLEDDQEKPTDQFSYLELLPSYFAFYVPYSEQYHYYQKVEGDIGIVLEAPLLQERIQFIEDTAIYRLLFTIFEVILLIAIFILTIIHLYSDFKRFQNDIAILVSQGMSLNLLKIYYLFSKIITLFISSILIVTSLFVVGIVFDILFQEVLVYLLIYLSYLLFSCFFIIFRTSKFKFKNISKILKDSYD